jgi:hypothetical protein
MSDRDTRFLGFAALLAAEIANTDGWMLVDVERLIARRAYDLVQHTVESCHDREEDIDCRMTEEALFSGIPDLTEWEQL